MKEFCSCSTLGSAFLISSRLQALPHFSCWVFGSLTSNLDLQQNINTKDMASFNREGMKLSFLHPLHPSSMKLKLFYGFTFHSHSSSSLHRSHIFDLTPHFTPRILRECETETFGWTRISSLIFTLSPPWLNLPRTVRNQASPQRLSPASFLLPLHLPPPRHHPFHLLQSFIFKKFFTPRTPAASRQVKGTVPFTCFI